MSKIDEDFLKSVQNFNEDLQNYYNSNKFDESFVKNYGDSILIISNELESIKLKLGVNDAGN